MGVATLLIEEVDGRDIRGIAIGNEAQRLVLGQGPYGFGHGGGSSKRVSLVADVIGSNLMGEGVEEEKGIIFFAIHTDVGFVTRGGIAQRSLVVGIESVTVEGGGLSVVEDGLITEADVEDLSEDQSGLAAGKGKRDMKGQDQADDVERLMDAVQIDEGTDRRRGGQLCQREVKLAVLIAELELGRAKLLEEFFHGIECS